MQKYEKILSIIVPVYNGEVYIEKCLISLLNQNLNNYEIILIDDGSTDKTIEIIAKYAEKYDIISTIRQENQGQGAARNVGISNAKGKYIMFVDSDDYVETNSISVLIHRMITEDLDLLCGNYNKVDINGNLLKKTDVEEIINYTTDIINPDEFLLNYWGFHCYIVLFIFKISVIQNSNFTFKPKIYLEDSEWLPKIISCAKKISMIDFCFYNYVQTPKSSMRDPNNLEKKMFDTLYVTKCLMDFKRNICTQGINEWVREMISINAIMLCSAVSKKGFGSYKSLVLESLKEINVFPLKIKRMPLKFKIMAFVINLNWNIAVLLISTINKNKRN